MFWKRAESLRSQLLLWLLIPLLIVLLINAAFTHRAAVETANLTFDRLLLGSADAIAEDIDFKNGELVVDLPYAALALLESNIHERIFYRILGPDNQTVTGYEDLPLPPKDAEPFDEGDLESILYSADYRGDSLHLIALKKKLYGTGFANPVLVIVAATGEARNALSQQIVMQGLAWQLLLIVVAGLLVWLGLGRGLRPLIRLRNDVAERSAADMSPIEAQSVPTEVRPLIDALNQHTSRIDRMVASRTRFIADATHQMRTPLTEMRTQIDYCLRQDEPALSATTLQDLRGDVDRLTRLVTQLLLQARADPDAVTAQSHEAVNLDELAREAAMEKVSAARQKTIDLSYEAPEQAAIANGNALLLHELIANLLDNAIAYTQNGGSVTLRVHSNSPVLIEVEDNGPGIPEAERDKVFERFYRSKASAAQLPAGSGLGLSIVRDIAVGHKAQLQLDVPPLGQGLRVRVWLPAFALASSLPAKPGSSA